MVVREASDGVARDDGKAADSLLEQLLGRKPRDGKDVVGEILIADPNHIWHQNHAKK